MTPTEKVESLLVLFNDDADAARNCVNEIMRVCTYWEDICPNMRSEIKYFEEVSKLLIANELNSKG